MEKITLTLGDISNSIDSLSYLSQLEMNVQASFRVGQVLKRLQGELTGYNEQISKLTEKYNGEIDGQRVKFPDNETGKLFVADRFLLDQTAIEIEVHKLGLDELGVSKLRPVVFLQLDWLFLAPSENGQGE